MPTYGFAGSHATHKNQVRAEYILSHYARTPLDVFSLARLLDQYDISNGIPLKLPEPELAFGVHMRELIQALKGLVGSRR